MNSSIKYSSIRLTINVKDDLEFFRVKINPNLSKRILSDCDAVRFLLDLANSLPSEQVDNFAKTYDNTRFAPKAKGGRKPRLIQE